MKLKNKTKSILSAFLAVCMLLSISPVTTFAAQSNEYVDPAENWLSSNGRTNELDVNATTTHETQYEKQKDKKKNAMDEKKNAIRAEDISRGVFVPVNQLPIKQPTVISAVS